MKLIFFQVAWCSSTSSTGSAGGCIQMSKTETESYTHIGVGVADYHPWLLLSQDAHLDPQTCTEATATAAITVQGC